MCQGAMASLEVCTTSAHFLTIVTVPTNLSDSEFAAAAKALSYQQQRLLRLTAPNRRTKEIIAEVPELSAGTIDHYLARATRALGAIDRFDAAQMFVAYEARQSEQSEFRAPRLHEPQKPGIFETSEQTGAAKAEVREERARFDHGPSYQALSAMRLALSWMQMIQQSALLKLGCAVAVAIGLAIAAAGIAALSSSLQEIRDRTVNRTAR